MANTGLSEVIGSWKIIAISFAPDPAHRLRVKAEEVTPLPEDLAPDDLAGGRRYETENRERRHTLPASRFTHHPERPAGAYRKAHPIDRPGEALVGHELGLQIPYVEERGHRDGVNMRPRGRTERRAPLPAGLPIRQPTPKSRSRRRSFNGLLNHPTHAPVVVAPPPGAHRARLARLRIHPIRR